MNHVVYPFILGSFVAWCAALIYRHSVWAFCGWLPFSCLSAVASVAWLTVIAQLGNSGGGAGAGDGLFHAVGCSLSPVPQHPISPSLLSACRGWHHCCSPCCWSASCLWGHRLVHHVSLCIWCFYLLMVASFRVFPFASSRATRLMAFQRQSSLALSDLLLMVPLLYSLGPRMNSTLISS